MKDIIHIMPDDKFIDDFIRMSEKYNADCSSYLIFSHNEPKYVKSQNKDINVLRVNSEFELNQNLIDELNNCKVVILHSFNWKYLNFIIQIIKEVKIIWVFWGIDGYNAIKKSKYLSKSSLSMQFGISPMGLLKLNVRFFLNNFISKKQKACREIIKRVDFCATFVKDDLELVKRINPNIEGLYFNYFNDTGYNILELDRSRRHEGLNILLGNSANSTNEHSSALKLLSEINFKGMIYCPLSYSGTEVYINNVIKLGNQLFGDNFIPLTEFLKYDDYSKIISNCDIVLMNHIRQQAVGNIFKSICLLKPVILNKKSYLRSTFFEWGIKIYDYNNLTNLEIVKLSDLEKNREIVLEKLNEKHNYHFFNKIIEISKS